MSSVPQIFHSIISRAEGKVSPLTLRNMVQLAGAKNMQIVVEPTPHDVVRTRSRVASKVHVSGKYDYLLFWDDDVSTSEPVRTIEGMLAAQVDVICTPYPKKREDLHAWRNAPTLSDAAAALHDWPLLFLDGEQNVKGHAREVALVPMGCTMISAACLAQMYEATPPFYDRAYAQHGAVTSRPHAMFEMRWWNDPFGMPQLLSEDHSFCHKWRELGGKVWINTASVCDHFGVHLFEGDMVTNAPVR